MAPALSDLFDFRVTGGLGSELITAGSSTLFDQFYTSQPPGTIAGLEHTLSDLDRFYDASGNFFLAEPQTITLVQGDGRRAAVTLYGSDSIADVEAKLKEAIHTGLGQQTYTGGLFDPAAFSAERSGTAYVRYVPPGEGETSGPISVEDTFVIQSAVAGREGEIIFSGDENVLKALSLMTIRSAEESHYNIRVSDAHSGAVIADNQKVSGNLLVGVVHENIDLRFDPMANTVLNSGGAEFAWNRDNQTYSTYLHLADNSLNFHIGANPMQDMSATIGDMSAAALGIDKVIVLNRSSANQAIGTLDSALSRVSAERGKLGANQNRLEYTANSLGVAGENLSAAESRIRDVDFARELTELTRSQLLQQSGTAILAQANARPQAVLALIA